MSATVTENPRITLDAAELKLFAKPEVKALMGYDRSQAILCLAFVAIQFGASYVYSKYAEVRS